MVKQLETTNINARVSQDFKGRVLAKSGGIPYGVIIRALLIKWLRGEASELPEPEKEEKELVTNMNVRVSEAFKERVLSKAKGMHVSFLVRSLLEGWMKEEIAITFWDIKEAFKRD